MTGLAILPSASVILVVTRSATMGIKNGIAVAFGIVIGDLIFISLSVLGLFVVAEAMGSLFVIFKYLGGAYLLWFGYKLLSSGKKKVIKLDKDNERGNYLASFLSGLLLTLGDLKAIFFYLSLLPTFVNLSALNFADVSIILLITIVSVGGTKIAYALLADRVTRTAFFSKHDINGDKVSGTIMLGIGSFIIAKT